MLSFKKILFLIFILLSSVLFSTIINVPADQPTIQAGIDSAVDADTVLVQPGTYIENVLFDGDLITVGSLFLTTGDEDYISFTIISGGSDPGVVSFGNVNSSAVLCGFTITNGSGGNYGGGINCYEASPTLKNLIITGNSALYNGGGIYCYDSNPNLENVTISNNSAEFGGGICCNMSDPILKNVTISGNTATNAGGGVFPFDNSNPSLVNCIIWNDLPEEIYFHASGDLCTITIAYSDVEGGEAGIVTNGNGTVNWMDGNMDEDPIFVDSGNGDYHLQSISPCIDAGDPDPQYDDPDGTTADMGAFYFNQAPVANFTGDVISGLPPLTVNFTDISTEGSGAIDEWYWTFGDGNNSSQQNPTNEYQDIGDYTVSLTVTNIYGFSDTITKTNYITVSEVYNGPVWHVSTTGSDITGNGTEESPFATIQHGINTSVDTETVLVHPGTYVENIRYYGKLITLGSLFLTTQDTGYISSTIIDGDGLDSVVKFMNHEDSNAVLTGFTITNGVSDYGGGIHCAESSPSLDNLIIKDNDVPYYGGGIFCEESNSYLKNVMISDNSSERGGGIFCFTSDLILDNVTIAGNTATYQGGGLYCGSNSNLNLVNCIIWNDSQDEIAFYFDLDPNSITISYSDVQGGEAGIVTNGNGTVNWLDGNMDTDPLFVDAGNGDYNLTEDSPCIDAGDPNSPLDPDGTTADMGAWYYNQGSAIEENEIQNANYRVSNYPNPFNPLTTIKFDIKENEMGVLAIFNIKGQLLESHQFEAGEHNFQWDASSMSSGVYLYQLQTENNTVNKKMLLLK